MGIDDANLGAACDPQIQSPVVLVNAQADARRGYALATFRRLLRRGARQ